MSKALMARLDRLLANLGYGSRKEVQALVAAGKVVLDGKPLKDAGLRIAVDATLPERMTIRGVAVDPPAPLVLMMHKPLGVVCSHKEDGEKIYDLLPRRWRLRDPALSTVGRLDKETSGLILITDDGDFLHRVISPKRHVPKTYLARLDRPLSGSEGETFAAGTLMLEGEEKPLLPARLEIVDERTARLTITEGRYHQVRRMFAAVGNHVTDLHRERIGRLVLPDDLEPGQHRILPAGEAETVFVDG
ncbi:rRNA pseudouridine synthase [Caulobacter segnis]|uniref:Pseudouridine synthase n=2 Tax=Caulobacter segnis TaxID=88688 RepID=D5VJR2_CAUST|nr:pseudouridine synthase [Caulobacter segnis]ADG10591.1 pseudouridine synthase [Caulobacter segnis ATCC 21756]AVQ02307.1 rRNA pseudouridine synthase [Caulobacter segnis]